ncbi:MAG: 3'-5' exonuclease [Candidatus Bathyarchaeota archaeon]
MEILVIDLETANINSKQNPWSLKNTLICEIGIVNLNLDTGEIKPIFNQTCKENDCPDPHSWIFNHTDLTYDEVSNSTHFEEVKKQIQPILESKPVTSWNQRFDFKHLENPLRNLVIPTKFWDPMCTLNNFLKLNFRRNGYKWLKVTEAFRYFYPNKKWKQNHRAIDDAQIEAEIIFEAVNKWPTLKDEWEQYV